MKAWEESKLRFDPSEHQDDAATPVRINLAALLDALGDKLLQTCVEEYNRAHGGQLVVKRRTTIMMPLLQMQTLFRKSIDKMVRFLTRIRRNPVSNWLVCACICSFSRVRARAFSHTQAGFSVLAQQYCSN